MYRKHFERILIVGVLAGLLVSLIQAQSQPVQRCGQEVAATPPVSIWLGNFDTDQVQLADIAGSTIRAGHSFPLSYVRSEIRRIDADIFISLRRESGYAGAVSILLPSGSVLTRENTTPDIYWHQLAGSSQPGQFSIFAYDYDTRAYLIDATFTSEGIQISEPRLLPFNFNDESFYAIMLYISPTGEYIGYVRLSPDENAVWEYFIYSVAADRFVWRAPYDGDGLVSLIWMPEDSEWIAIVAGTTKETASLLTGIDRNGSAQPLLNLAELYGERVFVSALGLTAGQPLTVFWVFSPAWSDPSGDSRLVAFDHMNRTLIDFCMPAIGTILIHTEDHRYVAYHVQNSVPSEYIIVDTVSGDYHRFTVGRGRLLSIRQRE